MCWLAGCPAGGPVCLALSALLLSGRDCCAGAVRGVAGGRRVARPSGFSAACVAAPFLTLTLPPRAYRLRVMP